MSRAELEELAVRLEQAQRQRKARDVDISDVTNLGELMVRFEQYLTATPFGAIGQRSSRSGHYYRKDVEILFELQGISDDFAVDDSGYRQLEACLRQWEWQMDEIYPETSTRLRKVASVNHFMRFLFKYGKIDTEEGIKGGKLRKDPKKFATVIGELSMLNFLTKLVTHHAYGVRDAAMYSIMYFEGLDSGEVQRLRILDISLDEAALKVRQYQEANNKSAPNRDIPIGEVSLPLLKKYEALYERRTGHALRDEGAESPYFRNKDGFGISGRSVRRNYTRSAREVNLPDGTPILGISYLHNRFLKGDSVHEIAKDLGINQATVCNYRLMWKEVWQK